MFDAKLEQYLRVPDFLDDLFLSSDLITCFASVQRIIIINNSVYFYKPLKQFQHLTSTKTYSVKHKLYIILKDALRCQSNFL